MQGFNHVTRKYDRKYPGKHDKHSLLTLKNKWKIIENNSRKTYRWKLAIHAGYREHAL
jgi:hypothetical protein